MKITNLGHRLLTLFLTFMKIGALTFGGGYAMVPIIQKEVIEKKKWMKESELLNILAISESTPGPISVNAATYVGYRVGGIIGSIVSTLGLVIPSFIIILAISYFYKAFISSAIMQALFKGIKVGVIIMLFMAVIKLKKALKFNILSIILFSLTLIITLLFAILNINFSYLTIILIFVGLMSGLIAEILHKFRKDEKK